MPAALSRHYRFERYQLDTQTRELRLDGAVLPLTAKAFDTLCFLVENRHQVVGKEALFAAVWPGRVVEDNNLTQAIATLRRALGTDGSDHRFVVTVPGRGYRFVAEVEEGDGEAATPTTMVPGTAPAVPSMSPWRQRTVLGAALFMLALFALAAWRMREMPTPVAKPVAPFQQTTLAVLPFRSLSPGPRDEGLELGLADTLITRLSRSSALQVRALTPLQRVGTPADARAAGRKLGAAYVVEGTTQRAGDKVRINARLVSVAKGDTVWADTFDARIDRVFTVQDALGDAVTSALSLAPVVMPARMQSPCDGGDALAYRAYLRGYYQLNRPDPRRMVDALAAFREAIDRDPTCARAWAGTAYAYRALVMTGDRDPRELFPLAKAAVDRALAIDPDLAEAHAAKGYIEFWYDWDWPRSEASLRHAIALNPNLAEAQIALAHLLVNIGRASEAAPYARRAVDLDPLSPIVNSLASSFLRSAGFNDAAARHLQKTLELEPEAWVALRVRGGRALARGDTAQALRDWNRAVEISGGNSNTFAALAKAYMRAGDRPAAERVLAALETRRRAGYVPATSLALAAAALGDTPRTLDLLERAYDERDVRMVFLLVEWDALHGEPRYQALLERMHLPLPARSSGAG